MKRNAIEFTKNKNEIQKFVQFNSNYVQKFLIIVNEF